MKNKKYNTTEINRNFDDTKPDADPGSDATKSLELIKKKLDDFDAANKQNFTPVSEFTALKTAFDEAAKSATDMTVEAKKQHDALLERFDKQEAQLKSMLPSDNPSTGLTKIDFGKNEDWRTKTTLEFKIYDDGTDDVFTKAIDSPVATPGAPTTAQAIYSKLQTTNKFLRYGSVQAVGAGESTTLASVGGISFITKKLAAQKPTDTGSLTSKLVTVVPHVAAAVIDEFAEGNLPDLDRSIVSFMAARAPVAQVIDMVSTLTLASKNGATKEITNVLKTGTASKLTATDGDGDAMIKTLLKLADTLTMEYTFSGMYLVSRQVMSLLQGATNNGYVFNPLTGINTLFGYPIEQMDGFADGTTDGNVNAVFGDFMRGIVTVTKKSLAISRYEATTPGYLTYHAAMSFKGAVWDGDAISTLITGAGA